MASRGQLEAAVQAGRLPERRANQAIYITLANGKKTSLVKPDGTATPSGRLYYEEIVGVPVPQAYPYEQPLEHNKWVNGFDGHKKLVRRMNSEVEWVDAPNGENYFKYNRDEYLVEAAHFQMIHIRDERNAAGDIVPVYRKVNPHGDPYVPLQQLDTDSSWSNVCMTVAATRALPQPQPLRPERHRLATEAQKEQFAKEAGIAWLRARPTLVHEGIEYHIIYHDSPFTVVWNEALPLRGNFRRTNFWEAGPPTTETLLNRPLREFVIPDGLQWPWDLHPATFEKSGRCVIKMLYESDVYWKHPSGAQKRRAKEAGEACPPYEYVHSMMEGEIETTLDEIFHELYVAGHEKVWAEQGYMYPFEKGWREDGCTADMVFAFCERKGLKCFVRHKRNLLRAYVPRGLDSHTPVVNFNIWGNHAYWYGVPLESRGVNSSASANSHVAQQVRKRHYDGDAVSVNESTSLDSVEEKMFDEFSDRQIRELFDMGDKRPDFDHWLNASCFFGDLMPPSEARDRVWGDDKTNHILHGVRRPLKKGMSSKEKDERKQFLEKHFEIMSSLIFNYGNWKCTLLNSSD